MDQKVNAYIAVLIITIFSSGITMIIVDAGTTKVITAAMSDSKAHNVALQQAIARYRNNH